MEDAASSIPKQDSRFSCNICLDPVTEPVVTRCGHLFCWPCLYRWLEPGIRPEEALASWDTVATATARPVDESRRCCPVCKAECSVPTLVPIYVRNEPGTPLGSARKTPQEETKENDSEEKEEEEDSAEESKEDQEETSSTSASIHQEETTGLRQRLRFRSRDSEIPEIPMEDYVIPSRPAAANSPVRTASNGSAAIVPQRAVAEAAYARPPLSPHQASLSHGMLLMFQQALNSSDTQQQQQQRGVPPLHRTPGDEFGNRGNVETPRDDATEFLSRLILILASFVILCLLLF